MNAPFFHGTRQKVINTVVKLGENVCCYGGGTWPETRFCDCKYGGPTGQGYSETTGCPELRTIHWILTHMSDDEFNAYFTKENQ